VRAKPTPAAKSLFDVWEDAPRETKKQSDHFHTHVAKVLHLAKRARPECLTAVSFLSTRGQCCDVDDLAKLRRLIGYLSTNCDRGIVLHIGEHMNVRAYIDAAYGVHSNSGRSHTGCAIVLGEREPIVAKSGKQKIVTKSPTEPELTDTARQPGHTSAQLRRDTMDQPCYTRLT
jgi:hypothetical protein